MTGVAARRIAFGDRPEAPITVKAGQSPEQRWLAAVALGARGCYAAAAALLDGVHRQRDAPIALRAHAAIARGAHLRQLGGHRAARAWDARGLALASAEGERRAFGDRADPLGLDLAAAWVDALLGLAADAIGLAELEVADRLVRRVEPVALEHPSWRPGVRWHWLRAELELARGQPEQAVEPARLAGQIARQAGALRHEIKSSMVQAVAEITAGYRASDAIAVLTEVARRARSLRLYTLEWPIEALLVGLTAREDLARSGEHRRRAVRILGEIRRRADPWARNVFDCSPWVSDSLKVGLLHSEPYHPRETCRLAQSSRMECEISP